MAVSVEELKVGQAVRLTQHIFDVPGERQRGPLGKAGEQVFIREIESEDDDQPVHVAHRGNHHESFAVGLNELELV